MVRRLKFFSPFSLLWEHRAVLSLLCGQPCSRLAAKDISEESHRSRLIPSCSPVPESSYCHLWNETMCRISPVRSQKYQEVCLQLRHLSRGKILFGWYFLALGSLRSFAALLMCSLWCRWCRVIIEKGNQDTFRSLLPPVFLCFQRTLTAFITLALG